MNKGILLFLGIISAFGIWLLLLGKPTPRVGETFPLYTVNASELGQMFVEGRKNFSVIDLSGSQENFYFKNSLKLNAASDPVKQILDFTERNRNQLIILVGEKTESVKELADQLMSRKYQVLALEGGIESWKQELLHPHLAPQETNPEKVAFYNKMVSLSNYLQGKGENQATPEAAVTTIKVERKVKKSEGGGGGC